MDNQNVERAASFPFTHLGVFRERVPKWTVQLPPDTVVVSADNHLSIGGADIWIERVPEHLKGRVPRVWWDSAAGVWHMGFNGKALYPVAAAGIVDSMETVPGCWNLDPRMQDLAAEGVVKELAFPQLLQALFRHPDLEAREWIFRAYNQYLGDLQKRKPGQFYGVAIFSNWWEPARAAEIVTEIQALGLKTLMLPTFPGTTADNLPINYTDDPMEPLWSALETAGLPVCFHIGENVQGTERGALGTLVLQNVGGHFRTTFGQLVFGGILDRHPRLRVVFVEGGIHWIPGVLQDAEMIYDSFGKLLDYLPAKRPSQYWADHCYATFMHDPAGLSMLDRIGAGRVMWSMDYPHNESTFGYSDAAVRTILQATTPDEARRILGGTAMELFAL